MNKKSPPLLLGAHTSTAGGLYNALFEGREIGATTIQFFTSNQRQWKGRELSRELLDQWFAARENTGIDTVMSHDSYLINLGSPKEEILEKSRSAFRQEWQRCHDLKVSYLNFHPGAALKEPRERCLDLIVDSLIGMRDLATEGSPTLLLEATAGQGSTVGCTFEELGYILHRVKDTVPIGVCIDTCHIFAAGYDIRTPAAWEKTLKEFDRHIGLDWLKAFHLNDSLKDLGSKVDRHKPLGEGMIGWPCFEWLVKHPKLSRLPLYLETPDGPPLWKVEIAKLRKIAGE